MQEIVCEDTNNGWRTMTNDRQRLLRYALNDGKKMARYGNGIGPMTRIKMTNDHPTNDQ